MDIIVGKVGQFNNWRHVTGLDKDQAKNDSENLSTDALRTLAKDRG